MEEVQEPVHNPLQPPQIRPIIPMRITIQVIMIRLIRAIPPQMQMTPCRIQAPHQENNRNRREDRIPQQMKMSRLHLRHNHPVTLKVMTVITAKAIHRLRFL